VICRDAGDSGGSSAVLERLVYMQHIQASGGAIAALLGDGFVGAKELSVCCWDSCCVCSTSKHRLAHFAALLSNGSEVIRGRSCLGRIAVPSRDILGIRSTSQQLFTHLLHYLALDLLGIQCEAAETTAEIAAPSRDR
jgi:hypothetical protein